MADAASPLETLFDLLPDAATNPVGAALHKEWVKIVEVWVPGGHTWRQFGGNPVWFTFSQMLYGALGSQDEGFTTPAIDPTGSAVAGVLGNPWWTSYAQALTTQAVFNVATSVRTKVAWAYVYQAVTNAHDSLRGSALASYVLVFGDTYQAQLAAVPGTGPARWQAYRDLLGPAWVALKTAQYAGGNWPDPAWELFHHAVKLSALGAAQTDVTAILTDLATQKLPMTDVQPTNWMTYAAYAPDPLLQWSDMVPDGEVGMLHYSETGDESWDQTSEGIAQWFVASTPFFLPNSGSCFTASTRVLLPDGSDRELSDVKPGDAVWTPDGPQAVRVVAEAQRLGRPLYRFSGAGFAFSDSHPFVDGADQRRSLAVHPARAASFAGGIAAQGVSVLGPGATITVLQSGEPAGSPVPAVEEVGPDALDEKLLDLILEPSSNGFPSFAVGDGGNAPRYLVRSEVLRYEEYPYGTHVGLAVLVGSLDATAVALADVDPSEAVAVRQAVELLANRLMAEAVADLGVQDLAPADGRTADLAVDQELSSMLGAFNDGAGTFDWKLGALQEAFVSSLLVPLDDLVEGGWRPVETDLDSATSCAVTVHDVVAEGHLPLQGEWMLELLIDGKCVGGTSLGDGTAHRCPVRWTSVEAISCQGGQLGARELGVRLTGPAGEVLSGRNFLPRTVRWGHRAGRVAVQGDARAPVDAIVAYDLRPLGPALAGSHPQRAPDDWDAAARLAFADRAVKAVTSRFAELFPEALATTRAT